MTCDHQYRFAEKMTRLDDGALMMRCICGEVFITHRQRKEAKPHIYFQHGYWRVTHTPKRATRQVYHLFHMANTFACKLNYKIERGVSK